RVQLLGEARQWRPNGHPRRIGVSSFGISGTNAHLLLEEAPASAGEEQEPTAGQGPAHSIPPPLLLSAKSPAALAEQARRLPPHLRAHPGAERRDIAFSLATSRSSFGTRAAVVGEETSELAGALEALAGGGTAAGLHTAEARPQAKLAFLFSG